jgi:hypothetical protein
MRVSRCLRSLAATAIAAAAVLAPAAVASARTLVEIEGVATPAIPEFSLKAHSLSATVDIRLSSDVPGGLPGTVAKTTIFISHGPRLNGRLFPSCNPTRLLRMRGARRACPSGSRIGGGIALGTSPSFAGVNERLTVDVYNGPRGGSWLFYFQGLNPVAVSGMINAKLTQLHGGRYGYRLSLAVPDNLQEISPDVFASLLRITTRIGGSVRVREGGRLVRHGLIEAPLCPPGALVPIRSVFGFRGGESTTADGYIACGHR